MRRGGYPAAELVNDNARKTRRRSQPARMRKARRDVAFACFPSARYRAGRKIPHLDCEIGSAALMYEVQDRHCRCTRLGKASADLDVTAQCRRQPFAQ